jgi:hypothetical protein
MKKVLFSFALLVAGSSAFSQINKGQWLAGGNIEFKTQKQADADNNTRVSGFQLSPNAGYFFMDQLAGGLRVDLITKKQKDAEDGASDIFVSPFVRYYFLPAAQKINVFADASYGFGSKSEGGNSVGQNQFTFMAGPAVFLTPNTALEFGVSYRSEGGEYWEVGDDVKRMNTLGFKLGFQIHLGNKK